MSQGTNRTGLVGADLVARYGSATVVHGVTVRLRPGRVTALLGPNGSGKSTVLRALARLHRIESGGVSLREGGADPLNATALSARDFARRVALLAQSRPQPTGLRVDEVVAFGRHPHRRRFAALTADDREAIARALLLTGLETMASRPVDRLSGGELQRVWLATCLAQRTGVLLLDEPTNHLDLRYQVETLDLLRELADDHGVAVGVVLHDLGHAAAVADEVVLLAEGRVHAAGSPAEVLTGEHLSAVYGIPIQAGQDPAGGRLRLVAQGRRIAASH